MKVTERCLWIAGLVLAGFMIQNQSNNNANLQTLLVTYDVQSKIQDSQISDFSVQLNAARDSSYSKGFEEGRTQAGVALAQGGSLYNYTDGYHAAMSQVGEEAYLDVAASVITELNTLRKMVPRLLNQINIITAENEQLMFYSNEDQLLELLLEADETYLDLISDLLSKGIEENK